MATLRIAGSRPRGDEEAQRSITRQLVETLEWVGFAYQGAALLQTAAVDEFAWPGRIVLLLLAAVHIALAVLVWRIRGPLTRGGVLMAAWFASAFLVPAMIAGLATKGTYASSTSCVQACTYPAAPVALLAFYPSMLLGMLPDRWAPRPTVRTVLMWVILAFLASEWFLLVLLINHGFTWTSTRSALSAAIWVVMAFLVGAVSGRFTRVVRHNQIELQRRNYEEFFDFLHSHVKAGLAAVRLEAPNVPAILEKVQELEDTVSERRLEMLLSADRVSVAALCSERIRAFTGVLRIAETPRVGARTVPREVGRLIERTLGDLLKNAVVHGARTAWIRFRQEPDRLILEILDDGPGFPDGILDNPAYSLHRLRRSARELGGDLVRTDRPAGGSQLTLTVPEPGRPRKGRS